MSFSSITERIKERMRSDGSYEQIVRVKKFVLAPFRAGRATSRGSHAVIPILVICGAAVGICACLAAKGTIMNYALKKDLETAQLASSRQSSFANASGASDMHAFAAANPFRTDPMPGGVTSTKESALSDLSLRGTLPGNGAWIADKESTKFYLKGQSVNGYTLEDVKYSEAILSDANKQRHTLHLILARGEEGKAAMPRATAPAKSQKRRARKAPAPAPAPVQDFPGIEPASGDVEGIVPRELVDKLLMNPYSELEKMRMEPAKNGSGLQLKRLDKDSIFARVGVAKGDVIQAVNGVEIKNMADAANAVNSLMAGTRFDVKVQRGGKPINLKYQVK